MDIDIDVPTSIDVRKLFPTAVVASMFQRGDLAKHPCGHYFENVPVDPLTGLSAIPYERAEELGFMKIDFLHMSFLDEFVDKADVLKYANQEPDWSLLREREVVEGLFQLRNSWEYLDRIRPTCVQTLADTIAIIRPAKRILLLDYLKNPESTRVRLYKRSADDKTSFRRSHAIAYAHVVVMQLNKISERSRGLVEF